MVQITCSRSGLVFEAENKRKRVHPGISYYTSHRDMNYRHAAIAVIERGKKEGWDTLEKFEAEIEKALNPSATAEEKIEKTENFALSLRQSRRYGGFAKPWVSQITGTSERYGFERRFLSPLSTVEGGEWIFDLEDGVYEICDRNSKGDARKNFIQIQGCEKFVISRAEVSTLTGFADGLAIKAQQQAEAEAQEREAKEGATIVANEDLPVSLVGDIVAFRDQQWVVTWRDAKYFCQDEDGITWEGIPGDPSLRIVDEWSDYTYYLKPATPDQIGAHEQKLQDQRELEQAKRAAGLACKAIRELAYPEHRQKPKNPQPQGMKVGYRYQALSYDSPYVQIDEAAGLLWSVIYNGRDGDEWRYSNFGDYIAQSQPLTSELLEQLRQYTSAIRRVYPDAIDDLEQGTGD